MAVELDGNTDGKIDVTYLPTGSTSSHVSRGDHGHTAAQVGAAEAIHSHQNVIDHLANGNNPHSVTVAQIGAATAGHGHSDLHSHASLTSLNKITELAGAPLWNGSSWPGGSGATTTLADIVSAELAGAPRKVYWVYGNSTDGGTTPDTATQNSIDALLSAGVPEANIRWLYMEGTAVNQFTIQGLSGTGTVGGVAITLSGGSFVAQAVSGAGSIEGNLVLTQQGGSTIIAQSMNGQGTIANVVIVCAGGTIPIDAISGAGQIDNVVLSEAGGGGEPVTIYSNSTDGVVSHYEEVPTTWATVLGGTGSTVDTASNISYVGTDAYDEEEFTYWECWRTFLNFTIPAGGSITSATITVRVPVGTFQSAGYVRLFEGTQASPLTAADYTAYGSTAFANDIFITFANSTHTFTLNASGIAYINSLRGSGGTARFALRHLAADVNANGGAGNKFTFYTSEHTNASEKPTLVIQ